MGVLNSLMELFGGSRTLVGLDETPAPGAAEAAIRPLIVELRRAVSLEVRSATTKVYLEGVLTRELLDRCTEILSKTFGPPAKPFDQRVAFEKTLRDMVESQGGIMKNQCLYLRRYEDSRIAFAALWPWSTPIEITLKVGVYD